MQKTKFFFCSICWKTYHTPYLNYLILFQHPILTQEICHSLPFFGCFEGINPPAHSCKQTLNVTFKFAKVCRTLQSVIISISINNTEIKHESKSNGCTYIGHLIINTAWVDKLLLNDSLKLLTREHKSIGQISLETLWNQSGPKWYFWSVKYVLITWLTCWYTKSLFIKEHLRCSFYRETEF